MAAVLRERLAYPACGRRERLVAFDPTRYMLWQWKVANMSRELDNI